MEKNTVNSNNVSSTVLSLQILNNGDSDLG